VIHNVTGDSGGPHAATPRVPRSAAVSTLPPPEEAARRRTAAVGCLNKLFYLFAGSPILLITTDLIWPSLVAPDPDASGHPRGHCRSMRLLSGRRWPTKWQRHRHERPAGACTYQLGHVRIMYAPAACTHRLNAGHDWMHVYESAHVCRSCSHGHPICVAARRQPEVAADLICLWLAVIGRLGGLMLVSWMAPVPAWLWRWRRSMGGDVAPMEEAGRHGYLAGA
jgi:hypothetical protein